MVGDAILSDSDEELRKQRKQEKKEKRRQERERLAAEAAGQKQQVDEPASTEVVVEEENESEEARRQRKAEKKERKRKRREEEAAAVNKTQQSTQHDTAPPAAKSAKTSSASPSTTASALSDEEVEAYRAKHRIHISTTDSHIRPITSFAAAGFLPSLLAATATFTSPSPIQSQCWPVLMQHRDCIAIADTGSGKTLGFLLPSLHHILTQRSTTSSSTPSRRLPAHPSMLVMSPTRELAMQTKAVCDEATKQLSDIRCAVIYGGVDKWAQKRELENGVSVIVATPGRLLALIEEGWIALSSVRHLVLDEADRMLDMGFEPDIRAIMEHVESDTTTTTTKGAVGRGSGSGRNGRQTLMFSATWPVTVQKLAQEFITNAVHINIGDVELKANHRVKQVIEVLQSDSDKQRRLFSLLQQLHTPNTSLLPNITKGRPPRILIFVLYKKEVDAMDRLVNRAGYTCVAISGDKGQQQRESALHSFRQGTHNTMIATDVVGRGLDIDDIDCVINYTFPLTVEDYVHRIGRTGRGGKSGLSVTFFTRNEKHLSGELINVLREAGEDVPGELLAFGTGVKRKEHGFFGNFFKKTDGSGEDGQPMKKAVKVKFDD